MWGNAYTSNLRPLVTLQKKTVRIITSSDFYAHSSPLFKKLGIMKVTDLVYCRNALFIHDYYSSKLPKAFSGYFIKVNKKHNYNTILASKQSYYLPQIKTNYGKFSLRYKGAKTWNTINDEYKFLSRSLFKKKIRTDVVNSY